MSDRDRTGKCESNACFHITDLGDLVSIASDHEIGGETLDTVQAWRKLRDDIKAGRYDHIGQDQP